MPIERYVIVLLEAPPISLHVYLCRRVYALTLWSTQEGLPVSITELCGQSLKGALVLRRTMDFSLTHPHILRGALPSFRTAARELPHVYAYLCILY